MAAWSVLVGPILDIVSKFVPDPNKKAEIQLEILRMEQAGEFRRLEADLQMAQGQVDINKIEATSDSFWKSGWRPGVGWVGVVSLGLAYIPKAIMLTIMWVYQAYLILHGWDGTGTVPTLPIYPDLGITDIIGLLGSILGIGVLRSWDKKNGA